MNYMLVVIETLKPTHLRSILIIINLEVVDESIAIDVNFLLLLLLFLHPLSPLCLDLTLFNLF